MTAKEMFEKLGWNYQENNEFITCTIKANHYFTYKVSFAKEYEVVEIEVSTTKDDVYPFVRLSVEDLQAINQQCKELGWE